MGQLGSKQKNVRVLMLGLDDGGKTTILYKLQEIELNNPMPTIGFNVEVLRHKNVNFTIWDFGGQKVHRQLWSRHIDETQALVFVIDASDRERISQARDELYRLLEEPSIQNLSLLILCNKSDVPDCMTTEEITYHLQLSSITVPSHYTIIATSGLTGNGLLDGLG